MEFARGRGGGFWDRGHNPRTAHGGAAHARPASTHLIHSAMCVQHGTRQRSYVAMVLDVSSCFSSQSK